MTFGSELRKAREAAGISLAQLATQTRIRASVIEDLESDRYVSTGGAAYARGHIRVIAKILETDSEYLLELFDNQIDEDDRTINAKLSDNSATASQDFKSPLSWKALGGIAALIAVGFLIFQGATTLRQTPSNESKASSENQVQSEPTTQAAPSSGVSLQLVGVNGTSWVLLTNSSGETIFSGMIKTGQSQTFTDSQSISGTIGNGAAVKILLNGKDLGIAGVQGEVLHLQFTPDGSKKV